MDRGGEKGCLGGFVGCGAFGRDYCSLEYKFYLRVME